MKKVILLLIFVLTINSCAFNLEKDNYSFNNFEETPLWELAQAVRADDVNEVKEILKNKKTKVDLKDPIYNQTLLALAIQNKKKNAFLELLKAGANPNLLVGEKDATPFIYGIQNVNNCNLFYVETMLKYGANPNLEIKNPNPEHVFFNSFPLFVAMGNHTHYCLDLIKLLVDNGANINCCYKQSYSNYCEGVIGVSLTYNDMESLRYFVIEKKITIPDTVIIIGEMNKSTQKAYGLKDVLNLKEYSYEDFKSDSKLVNRAKSRKARNEILDYLDKNKK